MYSISLKSTSVVNSFSSNSVLAFFFQWIGVFVAFVLSMITASVLSPFPQHIVKKVPAAGFLANSAAMPFSAAVNAAIFVRVARSSSVKGFTLAGGLFGISFLAQTFQTQIETAYFISAFLLLHDNFEVYRLFLRGAITFAIFALLVALIISGFSRKPHAGAKFTVRAEQFINAGAWLGAAYFILYILFGYFIAGQLAELRVFYRGPVVLNAFADQILTTLMSKPEMAFFQYARDILWIVCLIPLFKTFTGGRFELIILSALALRLLPAAQLAFVNPLMPAEVSLYHFWKVSISKGFFGALCAWFVPTRIATK